MIRKNIYWTRLVNLLKRVDPFMLFTRTSTEQNNTSSPANQLDIPSNNLYHQTTETLIYNDFLLIINGKKETSHLIIEGNPAPEDLALAWQNIQEQYSDCIRTEKSKSLLDLCKKILRNEWQIRTVDDCIFILRKGWNKLPAELLRDLGYPYIENLPNWDEYLAQVNMVDMEAKFLVVLQNQLNNEYKRMSGGEESAITRSMDDYDKELAIISKYIGFDVDKYKITTAKFCSYLNIYLDHIETLKKTADNGRSV